MCHWEHWSDSELLQLNNPLIASSRKGIQQNKKESFNQCNLKVFFIGYKHKREHLFLKWLIVTLKSIKIKLNVKSDKVIKRIASSVWDVGKYI